ncbi:hypothetical protein RGQ29_005002, partial [Quercus rubra]
QNKLTSRQLVEFYLKEIRRLNPILKGVIEVNPDALCQANNADYERKAKVPGSQSRLHGIPILLKDNIATKDKLNTIAGSFALLGSVVPRDAGVVSKLRKAGAIILGKASLGEWSHFRTARGPLAWSARGGQGESRISNFLLVLFPAFLTTSGEDGCKPGFSTWEDLGVLLSHKTLGVLIVNYNMLNPYTLGEPCGSSSGTSISVAANMVAVSLGIETNGSIICPASYNSVVGIKPMVGLTSRAGVIPISLRQDTVGPICRVVSDAVHVLDVIVGIDNNDNATFKASSYIPSGGYGQFLKVDGLRGKRLGIQHFDTLRQRGAILVDHLEIENIGMILDYKASGEETAMLAEFKISLNAYLKELVSFPVRTFNNKNPELEMINEIDQDHFLSAEATKGIGKVEKAALSNLARLSKDGFEKLMTNNKLDALPFGICFGGLKGSEPKLIEIAYGFEQAKKIRRPPLFMP